MWAAIVLYTDCQFSVSRDSAVYRLAIICGPGKCSIQTGNCVWAGKVQYTDWQLSVSRDSAVYRLTIVCEPG